MIYDGELRIDVKTEEDKKEKNAAKSMKRPALIPSKAEHYSLSCSRPIPLSALCTCVTSIMTCKCHEGHSGVDSTESGQFVQTALEVEYEPTLGPQLEPPNEQLMCILYSCAQQVQLRTNDFADKVRLQQVLFVLSRNTKGTEDFLSSASPYHISMIKTALEEVPAVADEEVQERRRALASLLYDITGIYALIGDIVTVSEDDQYYPPIISIG